jgi:uncharacterized protein (TIGR03437 family)
MAGLRTFQVTVAPGRSLFCDRRRRFLARVLALGFVRAGGLVPLVCLLLAAAWSGPSLEAQGFVTTVAGNGATAYFGEGLVATSAGLQGPSGLAVDSAGNIFIADGGSRIRKVTIASGLIHTVAGSTTGTPNLGFSGDGGPATSAAMMGLGSVFQGVAVDAQNNFYIADVLNHRIRKVDANGIITTFAGSGQVLGGGSGQATTVSLFNPHGVAVDAQGNVYIADTSHSRVLKVTPSGQATIIAGTGTQGFSGDGGPATAAQLALPHNVFVAPNGTIYIADGGNNRVRKIDGAGVITTVAGNGTVFFTGDGGLGPNAGVNGPKGLAVDGAGNLYIADSNDRIRKVDAAGIITTAVGNGAFVDPFKDGDPPLETRIIAPKGIVIDAQGTLYFADSGFSRVRKVGTTKPARTITGTFTSLSFTVPAGATNKPTQLVQVGSSADVLTFTPSATSTGGSWLSVTATATRTPTSIRITLDPTGLAAGVYDGTVTLAPAEPQDIPLVVFVTLTVTPAAPVEGAPTLSEGGVVNGASFAPFPNPIAAGEIVALFGTNFAAETLQAATVPLPTTLGNAQVLMNGIAAPLFFVSAGQINAQVPWQLAGNRTINVRVVTGNVQSNTAATSFLEGSPGIFLLPQTTTAIVSHVDGSLVSAGNPASRGEVVILYATGLGPVTNTPASGAAGPGDPLARVIANAVVQVGGNTFATVHFAGLSPGFVGLYQMNIQLPNDAPVGDAVNVQVFSGGVSNVATIAIR